MCDIIGIDLGSAFSRVAVFVGGRPELIPDAGGRLAIPSLVSFSDTGRWTAGEALPGCRIVSAVKRHLDEPYWVSPMGPDYTPQVIIAMILSRLKSNAERYLGSSVTDAAITVPACFSLIQRQAVLDAAKIAGLRAVRLLSEPSAAALAYSLDNHEDQRLLIYHLGSSSFDVSLVDVGGEFADVIATAGDCRLGGDDFDQRIVSHWVSQVQQTRGIRLAENPAVIQDLRQMAEQAKILLSTHNSVSASLPCGSGPRLSVTLTRDTFQALTADLVERIIALTRQVIDDAEQSLDSDVRTPVHPDRVLLTGSASQIPAVQAAIRAFTGMEPFPGLDPESCAAVGAAIQGAILAGESNLLALDVIPMSLGIEASNGEFAPLIPRNSTIPTHHVEEFSTVTDQQTSVKMHVLQGNRKQAAKNISLGHFEFSGIPPAPKGQSRIRVALDLDANAALSVSAEIPGTGQRQKSIIVDAGRMSQMDIDKAVRLLKQPAAPVSPKAEQAPNPPPGNEETAYSQGITDAILKLLPVYDNLERAVNQPTEDAAYKKGVEMTMSQMVRILGTMGVEIYGAPGEAFDPNLHNAVMYTEHREMGEKTIYEVFQKGFRVDGKIIRYAAVHVINS